MTHRPTIELIRPQSPPPGHDEESYARWQREFGELMTELKHAARNVVAHTQDPAVLTLLDSVQQCPSDPIGFGLVEHLYEFAAFHVPGRSGRTIAESALAARMHLPESLRGYLAPLSASFWDLYEATQVAESGALSLRRLHDDERIELGAVEVPQPFVAGTVQALRLFDAGGFQAAPVALLLEQEGLAELVSRLEVEQPGPFDSRAEYMRRRGSALILSHALRRHVRRLGDVRPMPEPSVSLVESALPPSSWKRLAAAFGLLEAAIGDRLSSICPLVLDMPEGDVLRVERNGPAMALTVFETRDAHHRWETSAHASAFVRVWRAQVEELFSEDVALLEDLGLSPVRRGAVVAVRLDEGTWQDVGVAHVDRVVEICRWAALRVQVDGELAA